MTTATSGRHPALIRPFDAPADRAAPSSGWSRIDLRHLLAEGALMLGLLALVVAVIAARFVFHAGGVYAPPVAAPIAIGATVVAVLAFIASAFAQDRG
jgi:hypothetical protein